MVDGAMGMGERLEMKRECGSKKMKMKGVRYGNSQWRGRLSAVNK
jgi:hypothetical protein